MDKYPKNYDEKENPGSGGGGNGIAANRQESDNIGNTPGGSNTDDIDDTDKYLAMEQPGVTYTQDTETSNLSDQLDYTEATEQNKWSPEGDNSKNSDAFNQDDYILTDNVDLDEDQNQSISSDDEDFEESNERY